MNQETLNASLEIEKNYIRISKGMSNCVGGNREAFRVVHGSNHNVQIIKTLLKIV
jgi:hypothetical protein